MSNFELIAIIAGYIILLAVWLLAASKGKWSDNQPISGWKYALSLTIYCTAWTFYGSVGRAADSGLGFLGVYLGPTLTAPLWILIIKKMIRISRYQRISSIADFASARYGKRSSIGMMVTLLCLLIVIPYISIQLKAFHFSYQLLRSSSISEMLPLDFQDTFYKDPVLCFVLICASFAMGFGTSKLDPTEKHPIIVRLSAAESVIKLVCFLIGGLAITFWVFDGPSDIFAQSYQRGDLRDKMFLHAAGLEYADWATILILSGFAFVLLPRQFHMGIVENNSAKHIETATWLTPAYMMLISLLVIPVAMAGLLLLPKGLEADTYLLSVPLAKDMRWIAIVVFVGGLAAISGMIIVSMISLSIMMSNNIFLPTLLKFDKQVKYYLADMNSRLLTLRRLMILTVMLVSYGFYGLFSIHYSIVSVGLISFAGIAQIAPMVFLGLYWKGVTRTGAIVGFTVGVLVWGFTLPVAHLCEIGLLPTQWLSEGLGNINWLNPSQLLGLSGFNRISHGAFWSLSLNLLTTIGVSVYTKQSTLEASQSDIFVHPEKYYKSDMPATPFYRREGNLKEIIFYLNQILGEKRVDILLTEYFGHSKTSQYPTVADTELINYLESFISGALGTASANLVFNQLVKASPVDQDTVIKVLDQTYQMYQFNQKLQQTSESLHQKTKELKSANDQLRQLDELKDMFVSNVTHELRTPITSIKSMLDLMQRYDMSESEKLEFLQLISAESDRMALLVNQVLDLRKAEITQPNDLVSIDLATFLQELINTMQPLAGARKMILHTDHQRDLWHTDPQKLRQILTNLISNAIKFTDDISGQIHIKSSLHSDLTLDVEDNGAGIPESDLTKVFDRFYQVKRNTKSGGTGLGLPICKAVAEQLGGTIQIKSKLNAWTMVRVKLPKISQ